MRYIKIEDLLENRNRWGQGNELWKNSVLKRISGISFTISAGIQRCPLLGKMCILTTFDPRRK